MRALLLCAGVSYPAGYPLAADLLTSVEQWVNGPGKDQYYYNQWWRRWTSFRDGLPQSVSSLLRDPNPEVVFSLLDVYRYRSLPPHDQPLEPGGFIPGAYDAFEGICKCIEGYFGYRDAEDRSESGAEACAYINDILFDLKYGDVVISFNWDLLVERALFRSQKWTPLTGYGVKWDLSFNSHDYKVTNAPLPRDFVRRSDIHVLKLHGSLGWCSLNDKVYFDPLVLKTFTLCVGDRVGYFNDPGFPGICGYIDKPALRLPSYLKIFSDSVLTSIWQHAADALDRADRVDIWGYSIPTADTAARILLNPLANRVKGRRVQVIVNDPSAETRERWRRFLGDEAIIQNRSLGIVRDNPSDQLLASEEAAA